MLCTLEVISYRYMAGMPHITHHDRTSCMGNKRFLPTLGLSKVGFHLRKTISMLKKDEANIFKYQIFKLIFQIFFTLKSRIKTWIRHFPGQHPFPNFLIFIIHRIMQGLGPYITPEPVQIQLGSSRPRAHYLENILGDI